MFEEKITPPGRFGQGPKDIDGEPLRPLTWHEVRARLDAARDLRRETARMKESSSASFAASAALRLRDYAQRIPGVNLDGLGNCKDEQGTNGVATQSTHMKHTPGDRGQDD
ncbi:MAG: hypothetical protein KDE63_02770 [Novosphingobium sp.]|nr:hypothetical protein [Novosphingobium sp.]